MIEKVYIKEKLNIKDLENSFNDLCSSNNYIVKKSQEINIPLENFKTNYKIYKLYKRQHTISSLAAIILLLLVPIKCIKAPCRYYSAKEYKYSTNEGITEEDKRILLRDYDGNKIYIQDFKIVNGEQEIRTYDASNIMLNDIKDYLTRNTSNLECDITYNKILSEEELNEDEIRRITKLVVNTDVRYDNIQVLLNIVLLLIIIDTLVTKTRNKMGMQTARRNALEIMNESLNKSLSELSDEIFNNDILRKNFVKLFNENKYLLNDPTLLEEKYNELIESIDTLGLNEEIKEIRKETRELKRSKKSWETKHM